MQLTFLRGESAVAPNLINIFLSLLALLVAFFSFRRWLKSKRIWYIISAVAAVLSGGAFWLARLNGYVLLAGAVLLFGLGELFKKK
jgi:Na+/melibiose symporter-like transporter